jgi:hypothetical protein
MLFPFISVLLPWCNLEFVRLLFGFYLHSCALLESCYMWPFDPAATQCGEFNYEVPSRFVFDDFSFGGGGVVVNVEAIFLLIFGLILFGPVHAVRLIS